MPSDPLPTAEYVQAYCDLWRRGRHENVLVAPVEQDEARSRARRDRKRLFSARSAAGGGLDVLLLVLRGLHGARLLACRVWLGLLGPWLLLQRCAPLTLTLTLSRL